MISPDTLHSYLRNGLKVIIARIRIFVKHYIAEFGSPRFTSLGRVDICVKYTGNRRGEVPSPDGVGNLIPIRIQVRRIQVLFV